MTEEKRIGIIGTFVFHLVILLALIFFLIYTPIPVSSGGGILIDFGNSETGTGESEPAMREQAEIPPAVTQPAADNEAKEDIMTQDFEEAPAITKKT
jgi:colicin import membrane protein